MGSKSSRRYPEELKARAVQMVADLRGDSTSELVSVAMKKSPLVAKWRYPLVAR